MRGFAYVAIDELEDHRIGNMEAGELVEGRSWKEDLAPVVCIDSLRALHHHNRVAAVVFIEPTHRDARRRWAA